MSSLQERKNEVQQKLELLRERMVARQVDVMTLNLIPNTAWITAGAGTYINEGTDAAAFSILVTMERAHVLTDGVEAPRLRQEEGLAELGFEIEIESWYARGARATSLATQKRTAQDGPGSGVDMSADLRQLRSVLRGGEIARMRRVSGVAAEIMDEVIRSVQPGMSEHELAARLAAASRRHGGNAVVNLVASDERVYQYRHPLPTSKLIQRYVMAVLCLRLEGLIPAITRLVHFGPLPEELRTKALAVAHVDAAMILGTQVGRTLGDMFLLAKQAYQDVGYPEAIEEHHQGGPLAYMPRELIANPGDMTVIELNQAFAWNPSIRGVKSEDTILLGSDGPKIITEIAGWPTWNISLSGQSVKRPALLEI